MRERSGGPTADPILEDGDSSADMIQDQNSAAWSDPVRLQKAHRSIGLEVYGL